MSSIPEFLQPVPDNFGKAEQPLLQSNVAVKGSESGLARFQFLQAAKPDLPLPYPPKPR